MRMIICPHCKVHRIVTARVPRDVVVVMPCPSCHELIVLFRDKVIAVSRRIIEHGSRDERRLHIADIIGEFLDAGMFTPGQEGDPGVLLGDPESGQTARVAAVPISQEEFERFVRIDLKCLDDAEYFKRHFG